MRAGWRHSRDVGYSLTVSSGGYRFFLRWPPPATVAQPSLRASNERQIIEARFTKAVNPYYRISCAFGGSRTAFHLCGRLVRSNTPMNERRFSGSRFGRPNGRSEGDHGEGCGGAQIGGFVTEHRVHTPPLPNGLRHSYVNRQVRLTRLNTIEPNGAGWKAPSGNCQERGQRNARDCCFHSRSGGIGNTTAALRSFTVSIRTGRTFSRHCAMHTMHQNRRHTSGMRSSHPRC